VVDDSTGCSGAGSRDFSAGEFHNIASLQFALRKKASNVWPRVASVSPDGHQGGWTFVTFTAAGAELFASSHPIGRFLSRPTRRERLALGGNSTHSTSANIAAAVMTSKTIAERDRCIAEALPLKDSPARCRRATGDPWPKHSVIEGQTRRRLANWREVETLRCRRWSGVGGDDARVRDRDLIWPLLWTSILPSLRR
jgi:hypothetical protein